MTQAGALVVRVAPEMFFVAGTGVVLSFELTTKGKWAGIGAIYEGAFVDESWCRGAPQRRLEPPGEALCIPHRTSGIGRLRLYQYE